MQIRLLYLTIALMVTTLLPSPGIARQERASLVSSSPKPTYSTSYKGSYALLVGADNYRNKSWRKLDGVKTDVEEVERVLKKQGFEVVKVLDPTLERLQKECDDFISKYGRDPDNRLLFYFAGHGHTIGGPYGTEGYIVPIDAPDRAANEFEKGAMSLGRVIEYAHQIHCKHTLFVFDACFGGRVFGDLDPQGGGALPAFVSEKMSNPACEFLTAGSATEEVPDKSVFREQFLAGISGAADADHDGNVTCDELWRYLYPNVKNRTKDGLYPQHPQFGHIVGFGEHTGDFVFLYGVRPVEKIEPSKVVATAYRMSDTLQKALNLQTGLTAQINEEEARQLFREASTAGDPLATMWIARNTHFGSCGFTKNEADAQKTARTVIADVKTLSESGNTDAMFLLGDALLDGLGIDKNITQATDLLRKAATNNNPLALNDLGYMCAEGIGLPKDAVQAATYYRHAAEKGLVVASVNLGTMYRDGKGVPQDYMKALNLFKAATEKGKRLGMYNLAGIYRDGFGVPKDTNQATFWYLKAAEGGDGDSMLELARLYRKTPVAGNPTPGSTAKNPTVKYEIDKAVVWYEKAVEAGNGTAIQELSDLYLNGTEGFTKDPSQAISLFRKAVARGNPDGLAFLGWAYDNGNGVLKDQLRAFSYYQQAADQGNTYSMMRLGQFYREGKVAPQDYGKAKQYFEQSESEQLESVIGMGQMYENGQGIPQSYQQAMSLYSKLAYPTGIELEKQTGYRDAQIALAQVYETGPETVRDVTKAARLYRRAAYLGSDDAMKKLAAMYEAGIGVGKDPQMAAMWRKNAEGSVKQFTVPCDTASGKQPFHFYIVEQYPPNEDNPLKDESERLLTDYGVTFPKEVIESFRRLLKIARDNHVSFCDLCVYALGTASEDAPPAASGTSKRKNRKPRDDDHSIEDAVRKELEKSGSGKP